jgi:hypothetical protein
MSLTIDYFPARQHGIPFVMILRGYDSDAIFPFPPLPITTPFSFSLRTILYPLYFHPALKAMS